MILPPKNILSKHQNKAEFKNLDDSEVDAVGSSRILIGKQKIGLTFNSDKLVGNDFTKFSKPTMCSA